MTSIAGPRVAADVPSHCHGADVRRFATPIHPPGVDRGTFPYAYRKLRDARPGAPTIIFVPGGPGDESMRATNPLHVNDLTSIPAHFGLILTDPRGVGCNFAPSTPVESFSNENMAHDLLGIVATEGLRSYYLHGLSAGTATAVVTAALAERSGAIPPAAVILEGVIGRADAKGAQYRGFQKHWRLTRDRLKPSVRAELRKPAPYGLDAETWGMALPYNLIDDRDEDGADATLRLLNAIPTNRREVLNTIRELADEAREPAAADVAAHYRQVTCRELADEAYSENSDVAFRLVRGDLRPAKGPACDGLTMDRPFDSVDYRIRAPLYYVQGRRDPSTPVEQARYSFRVQTASRRTLVTMVEGGHHSFWSLKACAREVWEGIERGGRNLESALEECGMKFTVDRRGPRHPLGHTSTHANARGPFGVDAPPRPN